MSYVKSVDIIDISSSEEETNDENVDVDSRRRFLKFLQTSFSEEDNIKYMFESKFYRIFQSLSVKTRKR